MNKEKRLGLRTWLEIDTKAIKYNYKVFRSLIPKQTKLAGVVKSNAYGHNLFEFAQELEKLGVDYLAVDSVVEGIALRREGIKIPILILGYTLPEMLVEAVSKDLDITVSNFTYFTELNKLGFNKSIRIHLKVDTGMHRQGFSAGEIKKTINLIKRNKQIKLIGLYTHFASAKNPAFPAETIKQINIFKKCRREIELAGFKPICHACATSGTIIFPTAHFDMVRIGIGLYGVWPSKENEAYARDKFKLQPALSWKTIVGEIKNIKAGERVGYDFTEKLEVDSRIAILPIGYWHGYPRALSSIGRVLINGQIAKIIGRVCMDIVTVDITNIDNVKVGTEVTLLGYDKTKKMISADELAGLLEASPYEILTRINPLIKRIYC